MNMLGHVGPLYLQAEGIYAPVIVLTLILSSQLPSNVNAPVGLQLGIHLQEPILRNNLPSLSRENKAICRSVARENPF